MTLKLDSDEVSRILEPGGPISRSIGGFEVREAQASMLQDVLKAYNDNAIALIEAGTGTGKSMAYLIPAILWAAKNKQRTVISTATIALQEQIFNKDIPMLLKALNVDVEAVLVKGMGNYICKRRLNEAESEVNLLSPLEAQGLRKIADYAERAESGSKTDLPTPPSHGVWDKIRAEADTCIPNRCPHQKECFFLKSRAEAEDAQILIVNHHMLFADLAIRADVDKKEGLLPKYHKVILDEAHHIEGIATDFFADQTSRLELLKMIARLGSEQEGKTQSGDEGKGRLVRLREKVIQHFGQKPTPSASSIRIRLETDLPALKTELLTDLANLFNSLNAYLTKASQGKTEQREQKLRLLPIHTTDPFWLEQVQMSGKVFLNQLASYLQTISSLLEDCSELEDEIFLSQTQNLRLDTGAYCGRLEDAGEVIKELLFNDPDPEKVRWLTSNRHRNADNLSLTSAKLDVSKALAKNLFRKFPSTILTSATLTTNGQFQFIRNRLGVVEGLLPDQEIAEKLYHSPFNFQEQALLAIPNDMPDPNSSAFLESACEKICHCIHASRGNTFVLFTSYSMLTKAYNLLEERLRKGRYIPMRQGEDSRQRLLERFRSTEYSVLFGTDSFWEGVDVAGDALRCVIIVKLPFQVPSEPIVEARTEAILARGGNPFMEYSVPNAIMKFKQGFGRLIRKQNDRGCIVCLDSRLVTKRYGSLFLKSLPPCPQQNNGSLLPQEMRQFYKRTYYLTKSG